MPLIGGKKAKTRKGFSENIAELKSTGKYPTKQAVAIAYSKAGEKKSKSKSKPKETVKWKKS